MPYSVGGLQRMRAPGIYTSPTAARVGTESTVGRWGTPLGVQQMLAQANQNQSAPDGQPIQPGNPPAAGGGKRKDKGIAKYLLSDEDYQNTVSDLGKNFQSYKIQNATNRSNLQRDFGDTEMRMTNQRAEDFRRLKAQFAARGLFGSGEYEGDRLNFDLDWQNQEADAQTSYNRNLSQLLTDLANSRSLYKQQLKDAKLSALRRRAEKLGIRS